MTAIVFGTDGWRGRIADTVTFANMRRVATAVGSYLVSSGAAREIALGYDTRFLSAAFAETVAQTLSAQGFVVHLSDRPCSTPAISVAAQRPGCAAGLMITASHNPASDNGLKIKTPAGASAPPSWIDGLSAQMDQATTAHSRGRIVQADMWQGYESRLRTIVDIERLAGTDVSVTVDAMHGATAGLMGRLLPQRVSEIRQMPDAEFGGGNPEPIAMNLAALHLAVQGDRAALRLGVAFDGDGDRIGVIHDGGYLNSHQTMALLLRHLIETRGEAPGEAVVTVSGSELVRRLIAHYGLPLHETPIGFKHIAARMLTHDVLIGGEESGGIGMRGHLPERDGPMVALLLMEMMAVRQCNLAELVAEVETMVGWRHHYNRRDLVHARPGAAMAAVVAAVRPEIAGLPLSHLQTTDGTKLHFADGSWLLVRASGTEPLLRLYAEAQSLEQVDALLDWAEWVVTGSDSSTALMGLGR